jgi:hypothetical protein
LDWRPPQRDQLVNKLLKKSFSREKTCKTPNDFEGQFFKTWLFQQLVNGDFGAREQGTDVIHPEVKTRMARTSSTTTPMPHSTESNLKGRRLD